MTGPKNSHPTPPKKALKVKTVCSQVGSIVFTLPSYLLPRARASVGKTQKESSLNQCRLYPTQLLPGTSLVLPFVTLGQEHVPSVALSPEPQPRNKVRGWGHLSGRRRTTGCFQRGATAVAPLWSFQGGVQRGEIEIPPLGLSWGVWGAILWSQRIVPQVSHC